MSGRIRFFNRQKFYGVVENEGGSWFFHGGEMRGPEPRPGSLVSFDLDDDPRRPSELRAVNVRLLDDQPCAFPPADPARLFVANVAYTVTEADLMNLLGHGAVEKIDLIRDSEAQSHRGYGFCQMADARSALNAIAKLHGAEVAGRRISVRLAEARPCLARQAVEQR